MPLSSEPSGPIRQQGEGKAKSQSAKEVKSPEMKCFFARREGLSTIDNCILFGERVIVPACLRSRVLKLMHNGHPGIERMKAIARSYVYWPLIDSDIAEMVKSYKACASAAKTQPHNAPIPWPKCSAPWQRVHMDFAGPIDGLYFLLVIDAYSKWPEIISATRITAKATVEMLRGLCSRFGMPNTIVSDNGRQFTSWEFEDFCNSNGIEHNRSPPYHPQSNGQAERFVDTFKRVLSKIRKGKVSLQEALDVFLLTYRSTPNKLLENQKTPADVMFNRRIRTTLELLRPPLRPSPSTYTSEHKPKKFNAGDPVYAKLYEVNKWRWVPGVINEQIGSVIFKVLTTSGRTLRSHINQLRHRYNTNNQQDEMESTMFFNGLLDAWDISQCCSSSPVPDTCSNPKPSLYSSISSDTPSLSAPSSSSSTAASQSSSSATTSTQPSSSSSMLSSSVLPSSVNVCPEPIESSEVATNDVISSLPVQPPRRSSRVRRTPPWMEAYRQY